MNPLEKIHHLSDLPKMPPIIVMPEQTPRVTYRDTDLCVNDCLAVAIELINIC